MSVSLMLLSLLLAAPGQTESTTEPAGDVSPKYVDVSAPLPAEKIPGAIAVELRTDRTIIPVSGDVMVEFVIRNRTSEPVTLGVPNALVAKSGLNEMGLPLEHVYSGLGYKGLEVASDANPKLGDRIVRKPEYPVPPITIAPFGTVGLRFDVARFYPILHQAGTYTLGWSPYGGVVSAPPITLRVVQYKQIVVETSLGPITMQMLYDKAPRHVENFLDLVRRRFYNGLTFHAIFPNQFVIGGCPAGDGSGRRFDGLTLAPEFNDTPFDVGTVGMALVEFPERDENSASSQFFICLSRQPTWDGRYTAFAQVEGPESLATLRKFSEVAIDKDHRPVEPIKIKSITALDLPFPPRAAQ